MRTKYEKLEIKYAIQEKMTKNYHKRKVCELRDKIFDIQPKKVRESKDR